MTGALPIVLIVIDDNSRLHVLQHEGVTVAVIDRRTDPRLVILPELNQPLEIDAAIGDLPILSLRTDDGARSAAETIRRIADAEIVVASGPIGEIA